MLDDEDADMLLDVPAGHCVQIDAPSDSEKEPIGQGAQSDADLPPNAERNVPATQNWSHTVEPLIATQVPGGQRTQVARPGAGA